MSWMILNNGMIFKTGNSLHAQALLNEDDDGRVTAILNVDDNGDEHIILTDDEE